MPGGFVCSGSMKRSLGTKDVKDVAQGEKPIRKLFSKEQRSLYEAHAPEGLALNDLSILGPIFVLKLKFAPEGYDRKLVAEMWLYPDNSMILELSTKCEPSEAFQVSAETRAFLTSRDIDLTGEQETKTKKALNYFAEAAAGRGRLAPDLAEGGPDRDRTCDLGIKSPLLYQLSYRPPFRVYRRPPRIHWSRQGPHRLAVQVTALSRPQRGFESRWGHGRLAQLGEHLPYKQGVACSSHAPPIAVAISVSRPLTHRRGRGAWPNSGPNVSATG